MHVCVSLSLSMYIYIYIYTPMGYVQIPLERAECISSMERLYLSSDSFRHGCVTPPLANGAWVK